MIDSAERCETALVTSGVTERTRLGPNRERALLDLAATQRLANIGSWSWDPRNDEATWSGQMYEIFGRSPSLGPATGEELLRLVHPEDRERVAAVCKQALGVESEFELDCRIITEAVSSAQCTQPVTPIPFAPAGVGEPFRTSANSFGRTASASSCWRPAPGQKAPTAPRASCWRG